MKRLHIIARDYAGDIVHIDDAIPQETYYDRTFPDCEMIPVLGEIKAHHFRYKPGYENRDTWDDDTNTMTEWHRSQQGMFPAQYQEVPVKNHRADVLYQDENGHVVIEFQHSELSSIDIRERTEFYIQECGNIVWVFDYNDIEIKKERNRDYCYVADSKKFISAFLAYPTIPAACEIFLHHKEQYFHVVNIDEKCQRFWAYTLTEPYFKNYIAAINVKGSSIPKEWHERRVLIDRVKSFNEHTDKVIEQYLQCIESVVNQRMIKESDATVYDKAIERVRGEYIRACDNIKQFINDSYDQVVLSVAQQALEIVLHKLSFSKECSSEIADAILILSKKAFRPE